MGSTQSEEPRRELIYADDGVTVIGEVRGKHPGDRNEDGPGFFEGQRWTFDGPGPQTAPKRLGPQAPFPDREEWRSFGMKVAGPWGGNFQAPDDRLVPLTELKLRNRSGRALAVTCGGAPVTLGVGGTNTVQVEGQVVKIWAAPDDEAALEGRAQEPLCELDGFPPEVAKGTTVTVLLREVGEAISASLNYNAPSPDVAPDAAKPKGKEADADPDAPLVMSEERAKWEQALYDAMSSGDQNAAADALAQLKKLKKLEKN